MPKGKPIQLKVKQTNDPKSALEVTGEIFRRGAKVYIVADFGEYTDNNKLIVNYYMDRLTREYPR